MPTTDKRLTLAFFIAALAAAGLFLFDVEDREQLHVENEDLRMPVSNPPVERDRPDLLEEPRIDE